MFENKASAKDLYYVTRAIHHTNLSEQYINIDTRLGKYLKHKLASIFFTRGGITVSSRITHRSKYIAGAE